MAISDETRKKALKLITEQCAGMPPQLGGRWPAPEEFTCARCTKEPECKSAWDLYNTDGDCLEEK